MKQSMGLKKAVMVIAVAMALFLGSCKLKDEVKFKGTKFFVISDVHYFAPFLGTSGSAFEEYLARDRKMLAESEAILKAAIKKRISTPVSFVLVVGDLTKDGELDSHINAAQYLQQVEDAGIQVYVTPGNHDIENPWAVSYDGDNAIPVSTVSASTFASIYSEFGYNEAIDMDTRSLSYIAEPVPGLWLFALDACRYAENKEKGISVVGGRLSQETLDWIKLRLEQAHQNNKIVIFMMHHGIIEHWELNDEIFPGYTIENWENISDQFAHQEAKIFFSGHFHAQDIVKRVSPAGNFIFDVQTGSLVSFPCPYRVVDLSENEVMTITHGTITEIEYDTGELSFPEYAENFLRQGIHQIAISMLTGQYGVSPADAGMLAPFVTTAMMDHFAGDEIMPADTAQLVEGLVAAPDPGMQFIGSVLLTLYNDSPPADNDIVIHLSDGTVSQ